MKTIIAVIFVGILAYAVAKSSGCQKCSKSYAKLGYAEVFNGIWYETHMKDASNSAICRQYTFQVTQKGILLTYPGQSSDSKPYTVTCSNSKKHQLNSSAPVFFDCAQTYKSGLSNRDTHMFFTLIWTVMGTDYTDHALVHRCMKYNDESNFSGIFLILHRDKTAKGSKAEKTLTTNRLDLKSFKQFTC
uniref:Salivary lipocalin 6 n=1 Tax=Triatoma brasiliensis TaxID=65344 RepID=A0MK87_TRIBS|nr:salivary lipocalin 6 [Triatoma brasiliensis]